MTMLDKLHTIGNAPVGTRLKVIAPMKAWPDGGKLKNEHHRLEAGTKMQIIYGHGGNSLFGAADLGDCLRGYLVEFEWFHCLELDTE